MTRPGVLRIGPAVITWARAASGERADRRRTATALLAGAGGLSPGEDPGLRRRCPSCGASDHGRLEHPGAVVSVAYSGALVVAAAAASSDAGAIGVDVEPASREIGDLAALFAPRPAPDIEGWTRIEAVMKADGRGILLDPSTIVFDSAPAEPQAAVRTIDPPGFTVVTTRDGPPGFVVSVAVSAPWAARR